MNHLLDTAAEEISLFSRQLIYLKKELPIRSSEMGLLIFVQKQNEGATPLLISSFFRISKPSVTAMINELISKGYLVKKPSETDRRSYTVAVTDSGEELVASTHSEYFRGIEILKKKMGDLDFESLINLIHKANTILSEERDL
ncbi:MarR family transcriptional regulator [Proteiniclasticum sp.]|uniref:MarR family winged helix-turn-helix transcriptional regulator n=1 Tax=Proteiniclasticum sp. TaxID=2053595 RepID=UPI00289847D2|nr:MarR family transcriptional regulator [Proteiniclasticum sp.]